MRMSRMLAGLGLVALALGLPYRVSGEGASVREVTFAKDVAPIVYKNCTGCHRPGEVAPFSLMSYKDARPWARAIREKVTSRDMPPWPVDPHVGQFDNAKRLTDAEVETIQAWVDGGAKEGNPAETPAPPHYTEGWQIGTPDLVVTMPEAVKLPATGTIPYATYVSEYVFPEDRWVQAVEVRPGNRAVVHHAIAGLEGRGGGQNMLHLYSPGVEPMIWKEGYGKFIPKGSRITFNMHYNAIGKETTDQTKVGFVFAKKPVHTPVKLEWVMNNSFEIPPMVQNHEIIGAFQLPVDARIHALRPHMHVRGKSATATLVYPDGRRKVLIHVPKWNDSWQYFYDLSEPVVAPKGSWIEYVADYDNSPANPLNPDPKSPVRFGQQVWEEMHLLYVNWTEITDANRADTGPIHIAPAKAIEIAAH